MCNFDISEWPLRYWMLQHSGAIACYVMRCNCNIEALIYTRYPLYRAKNRISSIRTSPKCGLVVLLHGIRTPKEVQIWNSVVELYTNWKNVMANSLSAVLWNVSHGTYMHDWKSIPILQTTLMSDPLYMSVFFNWFPRKFTNPVGTQTCIYYTIGMVTLGSVWYVTI